MPRGLVEYSIFKVRNVQSQRVGEDIPIHTRHFKDRKKGTDVLSCCARSQCLMHEVINRRERRCAESNFQLLLLGKNEKLSRRLGMWQTVQKHVQHDIRIKKNLQRCFRST